MSSPPSDAVVSLPHMNPTNAAVLKMVAESAVGKAMSDADRAALTQTLTTTDARDVQGWLGIQIRKAAAEGVALIKARGGLGEWFEEKWVDLSRPKDGGGFEPCGREEAESGNYPKCVPAAKAAKMTDAEIASAVRRKRSAEAESTSDDKKPVNVPTFAKAENVPTNPELYARVKAAAKKKFDVYPSAYANAWLVREYKSRGGEYRVEKGDYDGHPFRGNQWSDASGAGTGGAGGPKGGGGKRKVSDDEPTPRRRSVYQLASDVDDLEQSIGELRGMAEVERDLGRTTQAKATLAEAKSREKELKGLRQELEARDKAKRDEDEAYGKLIPVTAKTINTKLKGTELKELKTQAKEALKIAVASSTVTSDLADRMVDVGVKIRSLKGEARKEASAALKVAQDDIREAVGHRNEYEKLAEKTLKDSTLGSAVRMQQRGMDLGEMWKGATRSAERQMDIVETIIKYPTMRAMRSTYQISDRRGKAAETKFTNDSAALQEASEKDFGVSDRKYNISQAFDILQGDY